MESTSDYAEQVARTALAVLPPNTPATLHKNGLKNILDSALGLYDLDVKKALREATAPSADYEQKLGQAQEEEDPMTPEYRLEHALRWLEGCGKGSHRVLLTYIRELEARLKRVEEI